VVTARTGFGGALGNKGGVAVRLQIYDRYKYNRTYCVIHKHYLMSRPYDLQAFAFQSSHAIAQSGMHCI
jgi:hypothetical protein